jgi:hypothetical protein
MSTTTATATPLTFDAFWRWLSGHRDCVLRIGSGDLVIMDHDLLHWDFFDEDDGRAVAQVSLGKNMVGEVVIERAEILFVQASPDVDDPSSGAWTFECIGGPREDSYPLYFFVLAHGMEGTPGHQVLKH